MTILFQYFKSWLEFKVKQQTKQYKTKQKQIKSAHLNSAHFSKFQSAM